jgi:hypothetical protein
VNAFSSEHGGFVNFERLAVTPEQIERYGFPTAPPKPSSAGKGRDTTTRATGAFKIAATEQAAANSYQLRGDAEAAEGRQAGAIEYENKAHELMQVNKKGRRACLGRSRAAEAAMSHRYPSSSRCRGT